jgi:hypothetical protein
VAARLQDKYSWGSLPALQGTYSKTAPAFDAYTVEIFGHCHRLASLTRRESVLRFEQVRPALEVLAQICECPPLSGVAIPEQEAVNKVLTSTSPIRPVSLQKAQLL